MYLHDTITLCQDHIRASTCEQTDGMLLSTSRYLPTGQIAAKRSKFLDKEFYTDLLFYFGVWVSRIILKTVVGRFGLIFAQIWLVS